MQQTSKQKEILNNQNIGGFTMRKFVKELLNKRLNNEKGLTLIELLAVIVILGIIAAIAVPAIGGIVDNSRYNAVKADAINVLNAANLYFTGNNNGTTGPTTVDVPTLISQGYLETSGKIPNLDTSDITRTTAVGAAPTISLTTTEINYGGQYNVTFTGATIAEINAHNDKSDVIIGD